MPECSGVAGPSYHVVRIGLSFEERNSLALRGQARGRGRTRKVTESAKAHQDMLELARAWGLTVPGLCI